MDHRNRVRVVRGMQQLEARRNDAEHQSRQAPGVNAALGCEPLEEPQPRCHGQDDHRPAAELTGLE